MTDERTEPLTQALTDRATFLRGAEGRTRFGAVLILPGDVLRCAELMEQAAALLTERTGPQVPGGFRVVADPTVPRDEVHWRDAGGNLLGKITGVGAERTGEREPHLCICSGDHGSNDDCAYRYQEEQNGTDGTATPAPEPERCSWCGEDHPKGHTCSPAFRASEPERGAVALDPAEPLHLSVEAERRIGALIGYVDAHYSSWYPVTRFGGYPLYSVDLRSAMEEVQSLRERLRAASPEPAGRTEIGTITGVNDLTHEAHVRLRGGLDLQSLLHRKVALAEPGEREPDGANPALQPAIDAGWFEYGSASYWLAEIRNVGAEIYTKKCRPSSWLGVHDANVYGNRLGHAVAKLESLIGDAPPAPAGPERFMDQIDADRAASDFIESEAQRITDRPTSVSTWALEQADGRMTVLWDGMRAAACTVVFRDDANFSVLFRWPTAPPAPGEADPRDCFPTHGLHGGPLVRIVAYYEDGSEQAVSHQGHRHEKRFRETHWRPQDATGEEVGGG